MWQPLNSFTANSFVELLLVGVDFDKKKTKTDKQCSSETIKKLTLASGIMQTCISIYVKTCCFKSQFNSFKNEILFATEFIWQRPNSKDSSTKTKIWNSDDNQHYGKGNTIASG